jgi:tetratricopeptide (TPR) repeat protein
MTRQHLDRITLKRFAAADLDSRKLVETTRHLLVCPACRARLRREVPDGDEMLLRLRRPGPPPAALAALAATNAPSPTAPASEYDEIFHRIEDCALRQVERVALEKAAAPELVAELLRLPAGERPAAVAAEPRFHSAAVAVQLLERCRAGWGDDLREAKAHAELARLVAERTGHGTASRGLASDLQARAWAFLGNVRRIGGDLFGAAEAFDRAAALLEEGSGDPLERARLLDLQASLLRAQRRFDAALTALARVVQIYRRVGERHLEGRALLSLAMVHGCAGDPERGIPLLELAAERIDALQEPHLLLAALNNLLVDLTDLGRLDEAEALLPRVRQEVDELGTRFDHCRVRWAAARLDAARGRFESAEADFRQVREEFLAEGLGYEPALVSLELAQIYLATGRTDEVRRLAAGLHLLFATREIHREALAAFQIFTRAVAEEQASLQLVEELVSALRHGRGNPACRSDRPS